jgi:hypothetical protein
MAPYDIDILTASIASINLRDTQRQHVIKTILKPALQDASHADYIHENDDCFNPGRKLRKALNIKYEPWNNFVRLLCGIRHFPILLLQNPTNKHDKPYEEMITCPTIQWIDEALQELGLSLELVPILDICSLLSTADIQALDYRSRQPTIEKSYDMVEETLKILKPSIISVCQCATKGTFYKTRSAWGRAENETARALCSSLRDLEAECASEVWLGDDHKTWAVKGCHPMRVIYQDGTTANKATERHLKQMIRDMYGPCAKWWKEYQARKDKKMIPVRNRYERI